jgi:hypothetical protein
MIDYSDLAQARWGVAYAAGTDPAVRQAIEPLVAHRARQLGDAPARFTIEPGMTVGDFLGRQGLVRRGMLEVKRVPYYLLIVADPAEVPFAFQSDLDAEYATGRLSFADPEGYAAYVDALIGYEAGGDASPSREVLFWAPELPRDRETGLSAGFLAQPLYDQFESRSRFGKRLLRGVDASREGLLGGLAGERRPALAFAASHGLVYPPGHPDQPSRQGALLAQGWEPDEPVDSGLAVAGVDFPSGLRLAGLIHWAFASFSAGTSLSGRARPPAAPREFVAELPRRMLAAGALGFIGHVGPVWSYPFVEAGQAATRGRALAPYHRALRRLAGGVPIGHALRDLRDEAVLLAVSLMQDVEHVHAGLPIPAATLAQRWTARQNVQSLILLGDPAARLRLPSRPA